MNIFKIISIFILIAVATIASLWVAGVLSDEAAHDTFNRAVGIIAIIGSVGAIIFLLSKNSKNSKVEKPKKPGPNF